MTTAMQELIDHMRIDVQLGMSDKETVDRTVWYIETYFKEKEKQRIVDAVNDAWSTNDKHGYIPDGEEYYNQKFNQ